MIDDDLRAVGKVAELRLPQHQRLRIVATEAVLKAHNCGFRENGVVNFALRLAGSDVLERHVFLLVLGIKQHRVALVERAAARILAAQPDRNTGNQ